MTDFINFETIMEACKIMFAVNALKDHLMAASNYFRIDAQGNMSVANHDISTILYIDDKILKNPKFAHYNKVFKPGDLVKYDIGQGILFPIVLRNELFDTNSKYKLNVEYIYTHYDAYGHRLKSATILKPYGIKVTDDSDVSNIQSFVVPFDTSIPFRG